MVTTAQLRGVGVRSDGVTVRVRSGRLHRLHRGVYAVGHRGLSIEGRWMAAVLASGTCAALSHRSAAALWQLPPSMAGPVDVSLPGRISRAKRRGIRLHRSLSLTPETTVVRQGIPVTTPARTIADLRRVLSAAQQHRAARQAEVLGLDIGPESGAEPTRSELEHKFLRLCRRHRLPLPEVDVRIGPFVVDFVWPEAQLVVETDGYRFHRGRQAFEDDRRRDVELRLRGYEVVRFSYRQVMEEASRVGAAVRSLLNDRARDFSRS